MRFTYRTGAARCARVTGVRSAPEQRPAVTVVVTAYNYGRYLRECAESVLTQRDVDARLVIADDCSTDDTPLLTANLAAADPRVTVIRNDPNRGQLPSVNSALEDVQTEYVVKLDADDLLAPGALARATALLEARSDLSFVYGRPHHFSGAVPALSDTGTRSWTIWSGGDWLAARCKSGSNVISQPEVVMRTSLLRAAGWFRTDLEHTFDMHMWLTLATMGNVGRINGPAQGLYRVHSASMQRTIHAGIMVDLEGRRDAIEAALTTDRLTPPDADRLRAVALRSLAIAALDRACRAYDRANAEFDLVDQLARFATETYPEARNLREWRGLGRRRSVGRDRAPRHPRFFADAVTRRLSEELGHRHWLRTGEL